MGEVLDGEPGKKLSPALSECAHRLLASVQNLCERGGVSIDLSVRLKAAFVAALVCVLLHGVKVS